MSKKAFYRWTSAGMLGCLVSSAALAFQPKPPPAGHAVSSNQLIDREYNSKIRSNIPAKDVTNITVAKATAKCLASSAKDKAGKLIGGPMTEDPSFKALSRGLFGRYRNCAPTTEGVPLVLISGALAEELLRLKQPALQSHAVPTDPVAAKAFYATTGGVTIDSLGRCLAIYSPGLAYRMLWTGAGSAAESDALRQLYAETPACGVRVTPRDIPTVEQRSAVATGLYYWLQKG